MRSWTFPHRQLRVNSFIVISFLSGWIKRGRCSTAGGDFLPETKLGDTVEKAFGLFEKRLHVGSLHVRAGKDLLAFPMLDNHQALRVLRVRVHSDAMAGRLVSHYGLDDRCKLSSCRVQHVRPDCARDDDSHWFGNHAALREECS